MKEINTEDPSTRRYSRTKANKRVSHPYSREVSKKWGTPSEESAKHKGGIHSEKGGHTYWIQLINCMAVFDVTQMSYHSSDIVYQAQKVKIAVYRVYRALLYISL